MTQKYELYKCEICGNFVEMLHDGTGTLVCCGQPMTQMAAKPTGGENEKHQPVVEKAEHGTTIKAASVPHPMEEKHYIEWIEAFRKDGKVVRIPLHPGDKPETHIGWSVEDLTEVRIYCNVHGLRSKKLV